MANRFAEIEREEEAKAAEGVGDLGVVPVPSANAPAPRNRFAVIDEEEAKKPTPVQAAQTSISQAFNAPAAGKGGLLSDVGNYLGEAAAGFGSGVVAGVPFGLGPSIVGALTPGETTEDVERSIAEARKKSPIAFGAGEFGAELPTFLTGAAAGKKLAEKAGPAIARSTLGPGLRKAIEAMYRGVGLGSVTGTEAAGRAAVEGGSARDIASAGVETGVQNLLMPLGFEAAPILTSRAPALIRGAARTVAPTVLAVKSAPGEGADAADWTKWALTQGMMAGGDPLLETVLGPKAAYERAAASSRESLQPKLRRATDEGMELARGNVYEQEARRQVQERALEEPVKKMQREQAVRTQAEGEISAYEQAEAARLRSIQEEVEARQEAKRQADFDRRIVEEARKGDFESRLAEEKRRNRQFRAALQKEGRVIQTAANMERQGEATLRKLQSEAADLAALEQGLQEGTDPSLRGMLGKLFQDTSNRIMGAEEAVARNPDKYSPDFIEKLKATREMVDKSYIRNTEKGGYLEDFVDDPYVRLEAYRQDRLAQAQRSKDANAAAQEQASSRLLADFEKEARKALTPVEIPEARIRAIAEKAGLDYRRTKDLPKGRVDPEFGTEIVYPLKAAPSSAVAPESRVVALERERAEKPVTKAQMVEIVRREREARGERPLSKPAAAQERLRQLQLEEAEARLGTATGETPLQTAVRRLRSLPASDPQKAALEAQVQAEFERQVAAGGRVLQGRAPEADYGEKAPFFDPMNPMRSTAVIAPKLPDWVKPVVAGRLATGLLRASAKAPQSKLSEVQEATSPVRPTQATLERPYNAVAMLRAWDKVLEAPSDATRSAIARISDRLGITPDKLMRTTAYRAAALEQALKDPEVAKEVMANVQAP